MMYNRRPVSDDIEEDLLRFQQQFLLSGQKSSTTLVKCVNKTKEDGSLVVHDDKFQKRQSDEPFKCVDDELKHQSLDDASSEQCDLSNSNVLNSTIKERNIQELHVKYPAPRRNAFPSTFKCLQKKESKFVQPNYQKRSLFYQQCMEKKSGSQKKTVANCKPQYLEKDVLRTNFNQNCTTNPEISMTVRQQIHTENLTKLDNMTKEEILQEQHKLISTMDHKVLDLIRSKKHGTPSNSKSSSMGPVEIDKPDWMKEVPLLVQNKQIQISLRFDFTGNILSNEDQTNTPTYLGLHHHGDKPGLAGYTLQELMDMTRSGVIQQRVLSLRIIAKIIKQEALGQYSMTSSISILSVLLDAGFAFILRWALDENSNNCLHAAIDTLWALLCPGDTEVKILNFQFLSSRGCEIPALCCLTSHAEKCNDFQLVQKDLIYGLEKTNIIFRLRYILEVCNPPDEIIIKCLEILMRFCSHSMNIAAKVLTCPRLVPFLVQQYFAVPSCSEISSDIQCRVVQLLQKIAQSGQHACSRLIHNFQNIQSYLTIVFSDFELCKLKDARVSLLNLELLKLWIIFLSYGLQLQTFWDFGHSILLGLQSCLVLLNNKNLKLCQLTWMQMVLKVVSVLLRNIKHKTCVCNINKVHGLIELVKEIIHDSITVLLSKEYQEAKNDFLVLISIGIETIGLYYGTLLNLKTTSILEAEGEIETLMSTIIIKLHSTIINCSSELFEDINLKRQYSVANLPSLEVGPMNQNDFLKWQSSAAIQMLTSTYLQTAISLCRYNKLLSSNFVNVLSCLTDSFSSPECRLLDSFLCRHKLYTMYWIVKCFVFMLPFQHGLKKYIAPIHQMALQCFSTLFSGDEFLAHDLISSCIFHTDFMRDLDDDILINTSKLTSIHSTYSSCFNVLPKKMIDSKTWCCSDPSSVQSFLIPYTRIPLVSTDWPFLPLLQIYDITVQSGEPTDLCTVQATMNATRSSLRFIHFLESHRPFALSHIGVETKIARLMCVFLQGSDFFLDETINYFLEKLLERYCSNAKSLNFNDAIPGLTSFYDFYASLVEHYEAVSFGNDLFSKVVLMPFGAQKVDSKYKLVLWSQHRDALRTITLRAEQVFSANEYLGTPEKSYEVLCAYVRSVLVGCCNEERNPFLYRVVVQQVATALSNEFSFLKDDERENLLLLIQSSTNLRFKKHIFKYQPFV